MWSTRIILKNNFIQSSWIVKRCGFLNIYGFYLISSLALIHITYTQRLCQCGGQVYLCRANCNNNKPLHIFVYFDFHLLFSILYDYYDYILIGILLWSNDNYKIFVNANNSIILFILFLHYKQFPKLMSYWSHKEDIYIICIYSQLQTKCLVEMQSKKLNA